MITNKMNKTKNNKQDIDVYISAFTVIHQIPSYHLHIINYVKITIGNVFLPNLLKLDAINSIIVTLWKDKEERYEIR